MREFTFFGVNEIHELNEIHDNHIENIKINGFTVVENVITQEVIDYIKIKLDKLYIQQVKEVGGEQNLELIKDTNNVRAPLVYDDVFLYEIAANKTILEIVKKVLGNHYILMLQNGVINLPDIDSKPNAFAYHRDLNYQHFTSSRPLAISAFFCIDEFTKTNGSTVVVPGTHRHEICPSIEFINSNERIVTAKAGSVILFDSMMYHRTGKNLSDKARRGINNMYVLPFIKQQISFPSMLNGRFSDETVLKTLLGYESESDSDVVSFRQKRINRIK